jgi:hypothetical protein
MWSRVSVDSITTPGSATFQFLNAGAVEIDDIESLLGRASLRVGTTVKAGSLTWQPFVTGSLFHEFAGNATATSRIGGPDTVACSGVGCPPSGFSLNRFQNQVLETSTSRMGTYGQIGVGTAAVLGSSGWLGYGRVDYRSGANIEGFNFNTGLRYHW